MTAKKMRKNYNNSEKNSHYDVDEIIITVSKWQIEANSSHIDGYIRKYYKEKIKKLKQSLFPKEHPKVIT